jgi:hypothetical protein
MRTPSSLLIAHYSHCILQTVSNRKSDQRSLSEFPPGTHSPPRTTDLEKSSSPSNQERPNPFSPLLKRVELATLGLLEHMHNKGTIPRPSCFRFLSLSYDLYLYLHLPDAAALTPLLTACICIPVPRSMTCRYVQHYSRVIQSSIKCPIHWQTTPP